MEAFEGEIIIDGGSWLINRLESVLPGIGNISAMYQLLTYMY
mgnify:CR=1 FL=1